MSKRLQKYLTAKHLGGFGWLATYNKSISDDYACLFGYYQGMLDELIDAFGGPRRITEFLDAKAECLNIKHGSSEKMDGER